MEDNKMKKIIQQHKKDILEYLLNGKYFLFFTANKKTKEE